MRSFKLLTAMIAVSVTLVTSCKKDIRTETNGAPSVSQAEGMATVKQSTQISAELKEKLARLRASLPAGFENGLNTSVTSLSKTHPEYQDRVLRALGVVPTPCDDNTPVNLWLSDELSDWNRDAILNVLNYALLDLPTYDALLFENSSANQYFGVNGEYTQRVTKTFKDLKRFWNIQSDGIVLGAMHGSMLRDRERLIRTYDAAFGVNRATAEILADIVLLLLEEFPQYRNGDHPIFTFNAFALESFNFPQIGVIPSKIILGDGVLSGYAAVGFEDVAPQAILAHEFAHQIQFQLDLIAPARTPEGTRRTELMADAYAAYYLSHARGAAMQWKRVKQFLQVFYNTGDCLFTDENHHGTPLQRLAAAEWGYNLANNAQKQGHILTAEEFAKLFDAQLPELVK